MRATTLYPGKIVVECFHCGHRDAVTNDENADAEGTRLATAHLFACEKHPLAPFRDFALNLAEQGCSIPWAGNESCRVAIPSTPRVWCTFCRARDLWEDHGLTVKKGATT